MKLFALKLALNELARKSGVSRRTLISIESIHGINDGNILVRVERKQ